MSWWRVQGAVCPGFWHPPGTCPHPSVGWEARERLGHSPSWAQRSRVPPSPLPLVVDGSDIAPYHPYFIFSRVFLVCPTLSEEALSRKQALPWAHLARETKHSPSARCVPLSAAHFHLLFSSKQLRSLSEVYLQQSWGRGARGPCYGAELCIGPPKTLLLHPEPALQRPMINHEEAQGERVL